MGVREVAQCAIKAIETNNEMGDLGWLDKAAVLGYFKAVAVGNIDYGQSWVGDILRGIGLPDTKRDALKYGLFLNQEELLKDIFASGMCCDGQNLNKTRNPFLEKTDQSR